MEKAFRYRIYPNEEQKKLIQRTFGCCRFVYNHFLAERIDSYKATGKSPTRFQQCKNLTVLKKEEGTEWLRESDACALQSTLQDLDIAYQNFFRRVKQGTKCYGYPKFKSKKNRKQSYRTRQNIKVFPNAIQIPKLGKLRCRVSRPIAGRILSVTVSKTASGKYFVSILCTGIETTPLPKTGSIVGVDLGIKDMAITSDGTKYANNKYLYTAEKRLRRLQRSLSRKTKGSHSWEKACMKVARLYEKITRRRQDALHKCTTELVRVYDIICIENLNVSGMAKNRHLAKAIYDASFAEFRRQLQYKARWYGKSVSVVDRFYPSSQLCSKCGYQNAVLKNIHVRTWTCPACGSVHDRDINAAQNILIQGLRLFG